MNSIKFGHPVYRRETTNDLALKPKLGYRVNYETSTCGNKDPTCGVCVDHSATPSQQTETIVLIKPKQNPLWFQRQKQKAIIKIPLENNLRGSQEVL